jgi:DHA2 family multidrug resistance protein
MMYSHGLVPNIDYDTLVKMRSSQSIAIGFLFVPVTTLAYLTVPKNLNNDASALFTMFRNVAGSIGISVSTALIRERTQARLAHASTHLTPLSQNYQDSLHRTAHTVAQITGQPFAQALQTASGRLYEELISQATVLAYTDVFQYCAIFCVLMVPFTFLFSPSKAAGGAGGH